MEEPTAKYMHVANNNQLLALIQVFLLLVLIKTGSKDAFRKNSPRFSRCSQ